MTSALLAAMPAFLAYTFVQAITPGPANLCSMATALRLGLRPALRQWVGLTLGLFLVIAAALAVLYGAASAIDSLLPALTVVGAAYVLWLAWSMVRPSDGHGGFANVRPTIGAGVVLQVTNAKVLVMSCTALVAYVIPYAENVPALLGASLVLPVAGALCNLVWIYGGVKLQSFYEAHQRPIDALMAATLALCAGGMLISLMG